MIIFVRAKPNAREEKFEKIGEANFIVSVKAKPEGGRANEAIIKALVAYFNVPYSRIRLVRGFTSKNKIFEIL